MADRERRRRWDAGTVHITTRDGRALGMIGDHRVVRQADLAALLDGASEHSIRRWLDRMRRAGLVHCGRAAGVNWVQLTAAGGQQVDVPADPRRFSTWTADHATASLRLRLELQERYPSATWVPERYWRQQLKQLRERQGKAAKLRVPDGSLRWPDGGPHVAVEVELSRKHPEDYPGIVRHYASDITEVGWWCPPELVGWLRETLAAALEPRKNALSAGVEQHPALGRPHTVWPLPAGVRP